ncbi:hypothetical protein [Azotobacter salinestris]|uniref:hypothetical protein n=1 Tax=Azotobacter salinestris TaxID=69964 RepID=UPI0032DFCDD6
MWEDRLSGEPSSVLPDNVEPGRYWIKKSDLTFNGHTKKLHGVLVSDGGDLCQIGSETRRFVLPEKSLAAKIELFSKVLETLDGSFVDGSLQSPLMPAAVIDDQSHLLPFEVQLLEVVKKGHLHHISTRPRLDLHYEDEVADIARAKRLAKGALVHLASHSECWQRQTLSGVVPKKVLARFSEDDYNIYENRVYARLLDKIERHLHRRIELLKQLQATLSQALEFYEATDLDHRLTANICRLWGQTFDEAATSKASKLLEETLGILEFLFKIVAGLKQTGLYLLVHRNAQVGGALHLTNILTHDAHYRHVGILWDQLNKAQFRGHSNPEERYRQNQLLAHAYSKFAGLVLRHSLQPYMQGQNEAVWAGRTLSLKQVGLEWMLVSSVPHADAIEDEVLLTVVPWFSFLACTEALLSQKSNMEVGARVIACPALEQVSNQAALEGNWITLSPFDFYCVERFGRLVDQVLYNNVLRSYCKPIIKVPSKILETAAGLPALNVDDRAHKLMVREDLSETLLADLVHALRATNATQQSSMLELRQKEILALQICPVCLANVKVKFQEPAGFRANCSECHTERYLRYQKNNLVFEQKVEGKSDFRTLGRRAISLQIALPMAVGSS